jgi:alpha-galactosidase
MRQTAVIAAFVLPLALTLELPNGIGRLPALGWNSWNAYGCDVDQAKIMQAANAMVDLGFNDAGYEYVIIDGQSKPEPALYATSAHILTTWY